MCKCLKMRLDRVLRDPTPVLEGIACLGCSGSLKNTACNLSVLLSVACLRCCGHVI